VTTSSRPGVVDGPPVIDDPSLVALSDDSGETVLLIHQHLLRVEAASAELRSALTTLAQETQQIASHAPETRSRLAIRLGAGMAAVMDGLGSRGRRAVSAFIDGVRHND
jgi:hypothetical protein